MLDEVAEHAVKETKAEQGEQAKSSVTESRSFTKVHANDDWRRGDSLDRFGWIRGRAGCEFDWQRFQFRV
jgi:hypothetical protein